MGAVRVRSYQSADRESVRQICFDTGLMGNPVVSQYGDRVSFADLFSAYYTDREPEHALVVEHDGKVVGYMLGCLETGRMPSTLGVVLRHSFLRAVCLRPGTARFYQRAWMDALLNTFQSRRPVYDYTRYPSHLHMNLLPVARGRGIGKNLLCKLLDQLVTRGSCGIYCEVMAANLPMQRLIQKLGFRRLGTAYPAYGLRSEAGQRLAIQQFARTLDDWVPGAWQEQKAPR